MESRRRKHRQNSRKKWFAMFIMTALLGVMIFCSGCGATSRGKESHSGGKQELVVEHEAYQPTFYAVEDLEKVSAAALAQDALYYPVNAQEDDGTESVAIHRMELETMSSSLFYEVDLQSTQMSVHKLAVTEDGDLVVLLREASENRYELWEITAAGKQTKQYDITETLRSGRAGQEAYVQDLAVDAAGNYYLYVTGAKQAILILDERAMLRQEIRCEGMGGSLLRDASGQVIFIENRTAIDGWQNVLCYLSPDSAEAREQVGPANLIWSNVTTAAGEQELLFSGGDDLYRYDTVTGVCTEIFYWLDANIAASSLSKMTALEDGRLAVLIRDVASVSSRGTELVILQEKSSDSANENAAGKTEGEGQVSGTEKLSEAAASGTAEEGPVILTLGVVESDIFLDDWIVQYNRSHEDVQIKVKIYGEGDAAMAVTQLNADLVSGNAPDLFDFAGFDLNLYAAKGALVDLNPYLASDDDLEEEDFLPGILAMNTIDGGLYGLTPGFRLETIGGPVSKVGQPEDWTVEKVSALMETMPEDCSLFGYLSPTGVLRYMLSLCMEDYIDWESGTCSFDSAEFVKLLELASQVEAYQGTESDYELIRQGRMWSMTGWFGDVGDFLLIRALYGEEVAFVGIPSAEGGKSIIDPMRTFGITVCCQQPEAAWDFVSSLMSEEYQRSVRFELPARGDVFVDIIASYPKSSYSGPDYSIEIPAPTQEDIDDFCEMMERACGMPGFNRFIWEIVSQEAAAYFAGDKTAQEAADLIQNRVSLYVSENK